MRATSKSHFFFSLHTARNCASSRRLALRKSARTAYLIIVTIVVIVPGTLSRAPYHLLIYVPIAWRLLIVLNVRMSIYSLEAAHAALRTYLTRLRQTTTLCRRPGPTKVVVRPLQDAC